MSLRINDTAPDFNAQTTQGPIDFHQWIGDSWAILFSHPKDFTPVCTTELGYMARIEPEFTKRNAKLIGLSIDPVDNHAKWAVDIEETQGAKVNYPMIGDTDLAVAKLYNMLPAEEAGTADGRTAATNATVRSVFIVGPDKKIKLMLTYPMTTGRNFDEILRVLDSMQLTAKHKVATPVNWKQGEDVIIAGSVSDDDAKKLFPDGWKATEALPAHRQAAALTPREGRREARGARRPERYASRRATALAQRTIAAATRVSGVSARVKMPAVTDGSASASVNSRRNWRANGSCIVRRWMMPSMSVLASSAATVWYDSHWIVWRGGASPADLNPCSTGPPGSPSVEVLSQSAPSSSASDRARRSGWPLRAATISSLRYSGRKRSDGSMPVAGRMPITKSSVSSRSDGSSRWARPSTMRMRARGNCVRNDATASGTIRATPTLPTPKATEPELDPPM